MREIKFRAWDGKKMHYPDGPKYVIRFDGVMGKFNQHSQDYSTVDWIPMMYTGLKDKNGKDIYEGDILKESGYHFTVVWDDRYAKFKLKHDKKTVQYPEWNRGENMIIIGNIYQNPELL